MVIRLLTSASRVASSHSDQEGHEQAQVKGLHVESESKESLEVVPKSEFCEALAKTKACSCFWGLVTC